MGGIVSVREYQPVVHRLRLSASPYDPTNPGKISLTLEPVVIRRTCFSPVIRYSCLHSHSHTVHQHSHAGFTSCTTLPYPTTLACGSHSFGGVLEPRYIVGAESLDQWAVTHSFKGGCF